MSILEKLENLAARSEGMSRRRFFGVLVKASAAFVGASAGIVYTAAEVFAYKWHCCNLASFTVCQSPGYGQFNCPSAPCNIKYIWYCYDPLGCIYGCGECHDAQENYCCSYGWWTQNAC
jgi:hypothetical protein